MHQTRHCEICKHSKSEYNSGLYCGLTGKKPRFHNTCSKIFFDSFLETKLERAYIDLKRAKSDKLSHYGLVVFKITVGVILITFCNSIVESLPETGRFSTAYEKLSSFFVFMIIFIGIVLISQSMYSLGKRLSSIKYADQRIKKIDEVLNLYNLDYKVDVKVKDEFGTGLKEVTAEVKLSNNK